jgi:hypothetical protein
VTGETAVYRLVLWVLLAEGALSGCYVYGPVSNVEPQVGSRVSAELTTYGTDTLAPYVGPGVTTLRGAVVRTEESSVVLSLTSVTDRYGQQQSWRGEQVRVPAAAVERFQRRSFSLGRSMLLGAALLAGSLGAWEAFQGGSSGGALPPGGGTTVPK